MKVPTKIAFATNLLDGLKDFFLKYVFMRRLAMLTLDGLLILLSVTCAFALRLRHQEIFSSYIQVYSYLFPLSLICSLPTLYFTGWYRPLTRYAGSYSLYGLLPRSTLMVIVLLVANNLLNVSQPPRSFWILFWFLFTSAAIGIRIILRDILINSIPGGKSRSMNLESVPTLIYGAGNQGLSLWSALRNDNHFRIHAFLDDDISLHGRTLQGLFIYSPARLPDLIHRYGINQVLLALPSMSRERKRQLVDQLSHSGLRVLSIPSLRQLASGKSLVSDLRPVAIEDLLGREPSTPDPYLLTASVKRKVVLVTGAGGSIGSELCRQIVANGCSCVILFERNEFALYTVERQLIAMLSDNNTLHPKIVSVLGDVTNQAQLISVCTTYCVQTLFHAAAYKHVPIVEANICSGIFNNIRGTESVIACASKASIERVTLVSTDKAVRPTNAMGASKRICELLIQHAAALSPQNHTIFSMVRFGNVLASSGSVIPLFHKQIADGGPVTVTHPAITRYFMTIPEAVALVLQATSMAAGGDVFLLDMGEPVRIADLARQMIELSGLRVMEDQHHDGDITITYTGLRPGEKLYEELLISQDNQATDHPLIRRAREPFDNGVEFDEQMQLLEAALQVWDDAKVQKCLQTIVPEYNASAH